MSDKNLINVDFDPIADVANNLINKLSNAVGFLFLPRGKHLHRIEAEKSLIENISTDKSINALVKAALISNTRRILKEYENQNDIVEIAMINLKKSAMPNDIPDDWLMDFMGKCKNVCKDDLKAIWGKILAEECNNVGTISRKSLSVLVNLTYDLAKSFMKISKYTFIRKSNEEIIPFIVFYNSRFIYEGEIITVEECIKLQESGLIWIDERGVYITHNNQKEIFDFNGEEIEVYVDKFNRLYVGDVIFTDVGKVICKLFERSKIEGFSKKVEIEIGARRVYDLI